MSEKSDIQLINDYLKGDKKALEFLIKRYLAPIYGFVYRYLGNSQDAEDVTQEIFVKVWKNLKKFNPEKKFSVWIFKIAKNTSLDWLKKKKPLLFSELENESGQNFLEQTLKDPAPTPLEVANKMSFVKSLQTAISQLSPSYQEAITLHAQKELTFQEIADSTKQSINTIKSRYRRALVALKKLLTLTPPLKVRGGRRSYEN